jgi:MFS family permease
MFMKSRLPPRAPPPLAALKAPWKERGYALLVLGSGIFMLNIFSPYFNAPVLAASNGMPDNVTQYAVAILQAGSFVGRAAAGVLADRFGLWNVFGTMLFGSAVTVFTLWTPQVGTAPAILGMVLFGFFSGGWFTLCAAACASISPVSEIGMRLGMLWAAAGVPILVGPVVSGFLVTLDGDKFVYAGIFCGVTSLIGAVVTLAPRVMIRYSK